MKEKKRNYSPKMVTTTSSFGSVAGLTTWEISILTVLSHGRVGGTVEFGPVCVEPPCAMKAPCLLLLLLPLAGLNDVYCSLPPF